MTTSKSKTLTIIMWTFAALFVCVKYLAPVLVSGLYQSGSFELLNVLTGSETNRVIGFYQGRLEVDLLGPLSVTFSTLAFLLFSYHFLLKKNIYQFAAAIFVFLILTKFEVLTFLPYGDTIGGAFIEGIWLHHNNFDFLGLSKQPGFVHGGPKVYLFSIYPSYLALLMKLIPHTGLFMIINHILVFVFGAIIISAFRSICLMIYDEKKSMTLAVMLLALPLMQSQMEAINMEIPLTLFSVLALYFVSKKNIAWAFVCSALAAMVKGYGICVCACVILAGLYLFFFDEERKGHWPSLLFALLTLAFVVFKMYASLVLLNKDARLIMVGPMQGLRWIKKVPITYVYLLSVIVFVGQFVRNLMNRKQGLGQFLLDFTKKHYIALSIFITVGAWFVLFLNSYADAHRYRTVITPGLLFCSLYVLIPMIKSEKVIQRILIAFMVLSLLCSYGLDRRLFNSPEDKVIEHAAVLERSLEYRNDLYLFKSIAEQIKKKYSQLTVAAPFTIAQMMAFPELGYVDQPLKVILYGYPVQFGPITRFTGLQHLDIPRTIWVGLEMDLPKYIEGMVEYPVGPHDKVLEEIVRGDRRARLFLGGASIEKMRIIQKEVMKALSRKGNLEHYHQYQGVN